MVIGITAYGSYIPRMRMNRQAISSANIWFNPQLVGRASGHRSLANWDEDAITLAVAAARDALPEIIDRSCIRQILLASENLPFAERLNAGVVAGALGLSEEITALDVTGSQSAPLNALPQVLSTLESDDIGLVVAASNRKARAASTQELDYGDGAAAIVVGRGNVLAELLGQATITVDFIDHFRASGEDIDYFWEERWVRDEGIAKIMPSVINRALVKAEVDAASVNYFIFPSTYKRADTQLAKQCGFDPNSVVDNMADIVGDTGSAHALLMLCNVLETAIPGEYIVLSQFGSGAACMVFRVTEAIKSFKPARGLSGWLDRGKEETHYTKLLSYKEQLTIEKGMRGEADKKTALSTAYRHRESLQGFVAGRCRETGDVHFPRSRISYSLGQPYLDTQDPYPLADRKGIVCSWSAEYLSFYMAPPHQYGQVDFEGGGRVLMEFTDVCPGDIDNGTELEMVFRIKDVDTLRGGKRYFWKAVPAFFPKKEQ